MSYPAALRSRGLRILAKVAWFAVAVYAVVLMTAGLGSGFLVFDSGAAFAADRRGATLVAVATFLFYALAAVAWFAFDAPLWSVLVLPVLAVVCLVMRSTDLAFIAIPLLYPAAAAAAAGALGSQRSARPSSAVTALSAGDRGELPPQR